jgi:hypothetical protein
MGMICAILAHQAPPLAHAIGLWREQSTALFSSARERVQICDAGKQGGAYGHGHGAGSVELAGEGNGRPLTVSGERKSRPLAPHSVLVAQDDGPATARAPER